eukprot:6214047-Pleurochrysis_carterae.AAC.4
MSISSPFLPRFTPRLPASPNSLQSTPAKGDPAKRISRLLLLARCYTRIANTLHLTLGWKRCRSTLLQTAASYLAYLKTN